MIAQKIISSNLNFFLLINLKRTVTKKIKNISIKPSFFIRVNPIPKKVPKVNNNNRFDFLLTFVEP